MIRLSVLASLAVASLAVMSPAAIAEPVVQPDMPAISATFHGEHLKVRLARGVLGHTDASRLRTIVIEARDASGQLMGAIEVVVRKRLTYATIALPAEFASAATLGVSVKLPS